VVFSGYSDFLRVLRFSQGTLVFSGYSGFLRVRWFSQGTLVFSGYSGFLRVLRFSQGTPVFSGVVVLLCFISSTDPYHIALTKTAPKTLCLYRQLRNISIPIALQLKLFDTVILPILTYGCEVWGYENTNLLEKLHLQYCRNIIGVRTTTANFMTHVKRLNTTTLTYSNMYVFILYVRYMSFYYIYFQYIYADWAKCNKKLMNH
jgi:hypothetical protein